MTKIRLADGSGLIELKYLVEDVDPHGNVRLYVKRRGRRKARLRCPPGTQDFLEEYRAAIAGQALSQPETAKIERGARGSLRWLVEQYYDSAEFKMLEARTRYVRRQILDLLCKEAVSADNAATIGSLPYATMPTSKVRAVRDRKAATPEAANGRLKALRQVFAFAVNSDLAERNPVRDVPYIRTGSQGFHTWTMEEVRQYEAHHPAGTRARLALALLLFTGQRRSDVVRFGWQHAKDGWLTFTQSKNQNRKPVTLSIPILPELRSVLKATPASNMTFLVTEFGKPFTSNGFGNRFRKWCDEAGLPHVSAHGLRKAGAVIAAENGATERQLMAIFGWSTMKEAARYTRAARQKVLAASAMPLLISNQRETK
jgi:integrase